MNKRNEMMVKSLTSAALCDSAERYLRDRKMFSASLEPASMVDQFAGNSQRLMRNRKKLYRRALADVYALHVFVSSHSKRLDLLRSFAEKLGIKYSFRLDPIALIARNLIGYEESAADRSTHRQDWILDSQAIRELEAQRISPRRAASFIRESGGHSTLARAYRDRCYQTRLGKRNKRLKQPKVTIPELKEISSARGETFLALLEVDQRGGCHYVTAMALGADFDAHGRYRWRRAGKLAQARL